MTNHEVVIDGVIYAPATNVMPTVDTIMQALFESYASEGERWNDRKNAKFLWIGAVNEDGEGDSFEEFAARITQIANGGS